MIHTQKTLYYSNLARLLVYLWRLNPPLDSESTTVCLMVPNLGIQIWPIYIQLLSKKHPPPSSQGNLPDLAKVLLGEGEAKATFVPWELFSPVENRWNKSGMSLRIKGNHDQHET